MSDLNDENTRTFDLTPDELEATLAKLEKVNARAAKRGFTGRFELVSEKVTRTRRLASGLLAERVAYTCTLTGEAPAYEGWTFLASLEVMPAADGSVNWNVRCAPGVSDEGVDRSKLEPGRCDHCGSVRANRRRVFLVRHTETGEHKQVGSTCMKDFLGWDGNPVWVDTEKTVSDLMHGAGGGSDAWTPLTVLTVASAAVAEFGWTPKSAGGQSTADLVSMFLAGPRTRDDQAAAARIAEHLEAVGETAAAELAEATALSSDASYGYEANLHAALAAEHVTHRTFGLVCSAVSYLARERQQVAEKRVLAETPSEWIGEEGEKVTVTGEITTCLSLEGYMPGTTQILIIVTTDVGLVKVVTTAGWAYEDDIDRGAHVTLTGTVKAHAEYEGKKQTVLTRAKLVATGTNTEGTKAGSSPCAGEHEPGEAQITRR